MTLFRQLFLGASVLFFVVLAGVEAIYVSNARHYLQHQLQSSSQESATSLALWLSTIQPFEDRALIETVISTSFDRGYFESIRVVSIKGETLAIKRLPPAQGEVPVWFTRLFPLQPPSAESLISTGWRQLGRVLVTGHPNFAYLQLWHTAEQTLALLILIYIFALFALRAFLTSILRPLTEIENAATAIGERDFRTIQLRPRARELARVVAAINSLSGKIRRFIEDELLRAEKVQREADHDPVTGLTNRRALVHQLNELFRAERDVFSSLFVLLELERFKSYNLRHGYQRADELLALVAQTISAACEGKSVLCSRFGGASFALAAVNIEEAAARALVSDVTARVEATIAEQALADEIHFQCGAAYFHGGTPPLARLLANADLAMARAQGVGPNSFEFIVVSEVDRSGRGSLDWRAQIESAIEAGRLALFTQQVLSLPGRALLHSEVTTRIFDDVGDPVPAAQFLPMATRHGLMPRLDCRVLELLIERYDDGAALGPAIAINISAQTLVDAESRRRLLDLVGSRSDLAARLVFEMTEFGVIQDPAQSRDFAAAIRQLGAKFAIDHFGMHRDSLKQLNHLLPHYIKLAPVYTDTLEQNQDSRFFVASLVNIARPLEVGVIAQAVESESLLPLLEEMGFAGYQGYISGYPVSIGR